MHTSVEERAVPDKQRIWLVNLFFGAGVAPTGALLESVAVGLQQAGCEVEVVTGRVAYNRGAPSAQQRFTGRVRRLYTGPVQARGFAGRLLSWAIFYMGAGWFAFTRRLPDKVLILTTPPFLQVVFALRNLFAGRKAELILWNQDTYPEILTAVGILRKESLSHRFQFALQRWGTRRVHKIIVLDQAMRTILERHGGKHISIIPNWEIDRAGEMVAPADALGARIKDVKGKYRYLVLYTGNYGWGHNLRVLFDYLRKRPNQRDFFFLFVGDGEKWKELQHLCARSLLPEGGAGVECMDVFAYVPTSRLRALLREADFGLVALERACAGMMSPSKIHGYLAYGKPLIYIGPQGSNVAEAIELFQCGFQVDEDDAAGWERLLDTLLQPGFDYAALSRRAAEAAAARYVESVGVRDIVAVIHGRPVSGEGNPPRT